MTPMSPMGDKAVDGSRVAPKRRGQGDAPSDSMDLTIVWRPAVPGWRWLALTYVTLAA